MGGWGVGWLLLLCAAILEGYLGITGTMWVWVLVVEVVVEVEVVKNGFMRGKVISRVEIPHHEVSKSYLNSCKGRWYGGGVGLSEEVRGDGPVQEGEGAWVEGGGLLLLCASILEGYLGHWG